MFEIINIIGLSFLSDLIISFALKRMFCLRVSKRELFFVQIIMIMPTIVFVLCKMSPLVFFGLKLLFGMLLCALITDSYRFVFLIKLYLLYIVLMFSVYGFSEFVVLIAKAAFLNLFDKEMKMFFGGVCVLIVWGYVWMIYMLTSKLTKIKKLKNYLAKVSFSLFGRHIELVGLIDSGNSLIDFVTNKPVIVVSGFVLKKYFNYNLARDVIPSERMIDCVVAGGAKFQMPIFDVGDICVTIDGMSRHFDCVVGFVNQNFYDEQDYQCLIHRNCC